MLAPSIRYSKDYFWSTDLRDLKDYATVGGAGATVLSVPRVRRHYSRSVRLWFYGTIQGPADGRGIVQVGVGGEVPAERRGADTEHGRVGLQAHCKRTDDVILKMRRKMEIGTLLRNQGVGCTLLPVSYQGSVFFDLLQVNKLNKRSVVIPWCFPFFPVLLQ